MLNLQFTKASPFPSLPPPLIYTIVSESIKQFPRFFGFLIKFDVFFYWFRHGSVKKSGKKMTQLNVVELIKKAVYM